MNAFSPRRSAATTALLAALLAGPGWAQTAVAPSPGTAPAGAALPVVPGPNGAQPLPANRWTAPQIRQAFELADADSNGQLSRSESQRLAIVPKPFEDMDQNKDGLITRAEYEGAFVR